MAAIGKNTPENMAVAKALRAQGKSWDEIGDALGLSGRGVSFWFDPKYREKMDKKNAIKRAKRGNPKFRSPAAIQADNDAAQLFAQLPSDTRNLTERLCGDPLPTRSALYQKSQPKPPAISLPTMVSFMDETSEDNQWINEQ